MTTKKPHSRVARLALFLAMAIFASFPSLALAQVEKEINVSYESLADAPTVHGYAEHRFIVSNKSKTQSHTGQISGGADSSGDHLSEQRAVLVRIRHRGATNS